MARGNEYLDAFRVYWSTYGGFRALFLSPYALFAALFWAICKPIWYDQWLENQGWVDWPLSIVPSMISFSLGAMAIFLALSNDRFLAILRQKGKEKSYLMKVTTAYFHFILAQFVSLFLCFVLIAYPSAVMSGICFFFFTYALSCGLAAAAALLDMSEILNRLGVLDE